MLGESDHGDYEVAGCDACFAYDGAVDDWDRKMPTCWMVLTVGKAALVLD